MSVHCIIYTSVLLVDVVSYKDKSLYENRLLGTVCITYNMFEKKSINKLTT